MSALLKEVKDKKIDIAIPPIEQRIKLYTKFFEGKLTTKPEQVQGVETEIDPWVEFNNSCLTAESQTNPAIETTTEPAVIVAETESVSKPTANSLLLPVAKTKAPSELDQILKLYIEDKLNLSEIIQKGFSAELTKKVINLIKKAEFKKCDGDESLKKTKNAYMFYY